MKADETTTDEIQAKDILAGQIDVGDLKYGENTTGTFVVSNLNTDSVITDSLTIGGQDNVVKKEYGIIQLDSNRQWVTGGDAQNPRFPYQQKGLSVVPGTTGHLKLSVLDNTDEYVGGWPDQVFAVCASYHQGEDFFNANILEQTSGYWNSDSMYSLLWEFTQVLN
jgi:hypothetical protein